MDISGSEPSLKFQLALNHIVALTKSVDLPWNLPWEKCQTDLSTESCRSQSGSMVWDFKAYLSNCSFFFFSYYFPNGQACLVTALWNLRLCM